MTAKSIAFACLSLIGTAGLVTILVADEVRNMVTNGRWLQHDINRPKPPVVTPVGEHGAAPTSAPNDAVILFDGTSLVAWQTLEGTPTPRWKSRATGSWRSPPGTGADRKPGENSEMFNCM